MTSNEMSLPFYFASVLRIVRSAGAIRAFDPERAARAFQSRTTTDQNK
ncbi:hypothetical protein [Burkholderia sp. SRS-W-2-2016]|nr:hypothetical protein [Burkholderia sp. SRS-W-2-2016]